MKAKRGRWKYLLAAYLFLAACFLGFLCWSFRVQKEEWQAMFVEEAKEEDLSYLRGAIRGYLEMYGKYPESLAGLIGQKVGPPLEEGGEKRLIDDLPIEHITEYSAELRGVPRSRAISQGRRIETALDGRGGWCYDPKSGEVRINLTDKMEEVFPGYRGPHASERPCDW